MENNQPTPLIRKVTDSPVMGSFWDRFFANLIDGLILTFVLFAIIIPLRFIVKNETAIAIGVNVFSLFLVVTYYIYFYTKEGQTPGKKFRRLKVVDSSSLQYITWGQVILREIVGKFISGLPFDLGYLWYFMSPKRQTWHDSIASTYVVKTDTSGEILRNGPSSYKKKPILTFLSCGLLFLIIGTIFFIFIIVIFNPMKQEQGQQNTTTEVNTDINSFGN